MFSVFRFWPGISWTVLQQSLRWITVYARNVNLTKNWTAVCLIFGWHSPFPFQRRVLDLGSGCGATSIAAAMWVTITTRGGAALDAYATIFFLFWTVADPVLWHHALLLGGKYRWVRIKVRMWIRTHRLLWSWEREDGTSPVREFLQTRDEGLQGMGSVLYCCMPPGGK